MAQMKIPKKHLGRIVFALLSIVLIPFAFYSGTIIAGVRPLPPYNTIKKAPTAPRIAPSSTTPLTDSTLAQQAQTALTQFLQYLKTPRTNIEITLTDYKIQGMDTAYIKGQEIHTAFTFSARPVDTTSQQTLLSKGGTLQQNGWIENKKAYVVLVKKNNSYTVKEISFSLPANF